MVQIFVKIYAKRVISSEKPRNTEEIKLKTFIDILFTDKLQTRGVFTGGIRPTIVVTSRARDPSHWSIELCWPRDCRPRSVEHSRAFSRRRSFVAGRAPCHNTEQCTTTK